jgi:hypothetical protein
MGTNYYRIPTQDEMELKKRKLIKDILKLEMTPIEIERQFSVEKEGTWDYETPWDRFNEGIRIHLGKRSKGWKFLWNFNDNKYYTNKEELLNFIRSGRVVDEYGDEIYVEEFINMSLNWEQPYGLDSVSSQKVNNTNRYGTPHDKDIDGLRVASFTDFS